MNIPLLLIILALILAALSYWKPVLLGVSAILTNAALLIGRLALIALCALSLGGCTMSEALNIGDALVVGYSDYKARQQPAQAYVAP